MNSEATPPDLPPTPPPAAPSALPPGSVPELPASLATRARALIACLGRPGIALGVIAVLFALLWLDARFTLADLREELASRLAASDTQIKETRAVVRQHQEGGRLLDERVTTLETQLAETLGERLALEQMYQELSRGRDERVIAEVEQTVAIAAQQLQLAGNVEAALIALAGADARLARAANPQYLPLRKLIARDTDRLRALPTADVSGIAVKLESVIASVDAMPLAFEQRPVRGEAQKAATILPKAPAPSVERLAAELWADLRQLVRVERIDGSGAPDPALLPPSHVFFLRENVKLRLVNARLALLSRDARSFREDIRMAREWLGRYFDSRAKPVQAALATLKLLDTTDVAVTPPSLNETLAALRNFKAPKK